MRGALSCAVLVARGGWLGYLGHRPGLAIRVGGLSRSGAARFAAVPTVASRPARAVRSRCACRISPMTLRMSSSVIDRHGCCREHLLWRQRSFGHPYGACPRCCTRGAFGMRARDWRVHAHADQAGRRGHGRRGQTPGRLHGTHANTARPRPASRPCRRCLACAICTLTSAAPGRLPAASSINREEPDTDDLPAPWNACRGHDELGRCRCIGRWL